MNRGYYWEDYVLSTNLLPVANRWSIKETYWFKMGYSETPLLKLLYLEQEGIL